MNGATERQERALRCALLVQEAALQRHAFRAGRQRLAEAPAAALPQLLVSVLPWLDTALRVRRLLRAHPTLTVVALALAAWRHVATRHEVPKDAH